MDMMENSGHWINALRNGCFFKVISLISETYKVLIVDSPFLFNFWQDLYSNSAILQNCFMNRLFQGDTNLISNILSSGRDRILED